MVRSKIKYQLVTLTIAAANNTADIDLDTDKSYEFITGLQMVSQDATAPDASTFSKPLTINGVEIFPEDFDIKLLTAGQELNSSDRFYGLKEPAKGSKVKATFKDGNTANAYPYTIRLYVRLENPDAAPAK